MRSLLKRHFYTGVVAYLGTTESGGKCKKPAALYPGQHPALIDQDTFDRCQDVRRALGKATRDRSTGREPRVHLLSGLLRYGECGSVLRAYSTTTGYRYYRCSTRIENRGRCRQRAVRAEEIEDRLIGLMRGLQLRVDWQQHLLAQASPPRELAAQAAEKARLIERLQRAKQLYLVGDLSREQYDAEQSECKQRITALSDYTASEIQSAAQLFQMADVDWAGLTRLRQKSLVQRALARATVLDGRLRAVQPTSAAHLLMKMALEREPSSLCSLCHSGSDGI